MKTYIALALAFAAYFGLLAYIVHMRHPPRYELLCCQEQQYSPGSPLDRNGGDER